MAIFVSVHNYLFTGVIALLSSFPSSLIELWMISRVERNALMTMLLLGDWFSLNGRIADCLLAVMWRLILWHESGVKVCSHFCGMTFQVCVCVCVCVCVFQSTSTLSSFLPLSVACSPSKVASPPGGLFPIWAWPQSHGRLQLLFPIPAI